MGLRAGQYIGTMATIIKARPISASRLGTYVANHSGQVDETGVAWPKIPDQIDCKSNNHQRPAEEFNARHA